MLVCLYIYIYMYACLVNKILKGVIKNDTVRSFSITLKFTGFGSPPSFCINKNLIHRLYKKVVCSLLSHCNEGEKREKADERSKTFSSQVHTRFEEQHQKWNVAFFNCLIQM